jgi:hypothetical protein
MCMYACMCISHDGMIVCVCVYAYMYLIMRMHTCICVCDEHDDADLIDFL